MRSRITLNRMDIFGLLAVGVTTFFFLETALDAVGVYTRVRPMSVGDIVVGCSGWLLATFGPTILAVGFWRAAKRLRRAWLLHILMLPLSLAMLRIGEFLMLSVTGTRDFDDTIGGPVIQALALLLLAVIGYYSAVLHIASKRWAAAAGGN